MLNKDVITNHYNYFLKYLPLALNIQLIDRNLRSGKDDYTRFIILGTARTGSNLLMTSLKSHKHIISYGEIFNQQEVRDWDIPILYRNFSDFNLLKEKPVEFMANRIFRKYPDTIKAVGFKIFYAHTPFHQEHKDLVWQYLKKDCRIKIIHIRRRNILETYLSHTIALKTGKWVNIFNTNVTDADDIRVTIDYNECLEDFENTRKMENEYDALFTGHEKINVYYENLNNNFSEEIENIQIFLGLEPYPLKPQIFKQSCHKPRELINNFDELKNRFSSTEWKCFFEE